MFYNNTSLTLLHLEIFFQVVNYYKISSHVCQISSPQRPPPIHTSSISHIVSHISLLTRKSTEAAITYTSFHESLGSLKLLWGHWACKESNFHSLFFPSPPLPLALSPWLLLSLAHLLTAAQMMPTSIYLTSLTSLYNNHVNSEVSPWRTVG